jgi:hypothetical protein
MQIISTSLYTPSYQTSTQKNPASKGSVQDKNSLDASQMQMIEKLQARDTEVKAHEAAHKAAGGALAGSASYTYQKGPDNKMYAIGGEVPISFKEGSTPEETKANARQVAAAAMAPANPSPQDYGVASNARMMEIKADQKIFKELQQQQNAKKAGETYQENQNSI